MIDTEEEKRHTTSILEGLFIKIDDIGDMEIGIEREDNRETEKTKKTFKQQTDTEKISQVILRDKAVWTRVNQKMKMSNITITKAKNVNEGISITPSSSSDYRALTKMLDKSRLEYHT
ncbi:hypothetical protein WA026_016539 [Henosepilachna vigintioctopunctata]|uniref:Uncharacterized protein n=1 Tax=Henosepilachna vigintioctopunctata TaxID=420089 RepID=A0AAW1VFJ6_9CUCU